MDDWTPVNGSLNHAHPYKIFFVEIVRSRGWTIGDVENWFPPFAEYLPIYIEKHCVIEGMSDAKAVMQAILADRECVEPFPGYLVKKALEKKQ